MSDFSEKKQKILTCIRNYDIYYVEFKLIIHAAAKNIIISKVEWSN